MTTPAAVSPANLLVRGGYVLTMDSLGDVAEGDVYIRDGVIQEIGRNLDVPGAELVDASGKIVAPGFVETHWHMWNTLLRGMADGTPARRGYFATTARFGPHFLPGDTYAGTRLAAAEAIDAGITTVHDWAHNVRGKEWAEAGIRALAESGLRARFSYGFAAGHPIDQPMDLDSLAEVAAAWPSYGTDGRIHLGVGWRGIGPFPGAPAPAAVFQAEIETARSLGLPLSAHASGPAIAAGQIRSYADLGLLGPDLQFVHLNHASPEEMALAAGGTSGVSLAPWTELQLGFGQPPTVELLAAGLPVGLSVDTTVLAGNADMFAIMKVTHASANERAGEEFALTTRDVLRLATIDGARTLGLDAVTGSLAPGKRADLIVVSVDSPSLGVFTDPVRLLVTAATPRDVELVVADGRILKRDGVVLAFDAPEVVRAARTALAGVLSRADA